VNALCQVAGWPADTAAVAVLGREGEVAALGPRDRVLRWASVTKLLTAYACLVSLEEGVLDLGELAGPPGATVRHLLAHASGLPFEGDGPPIAEPGTRRVYSNPGFEALAEHVASRADMPFEQYLRSAVLEPLEIDAELHGSPAHALYGTLDDLVRFARELLRPRLVAPETLVEATAVQFPGLSGVLPGMGRFEPLDWGLGFEVKGGKDPHWSGEATSPRTFGHFGGSGTFLWVDPDADVAVACLTDREFGPWALEAWPKLADAVLEETGRASEPPD
jgi:CubicO group peptidase (beta-lactamase class C family)